MLRQPRPFPSCSSTVGSWTVRLAGHLQHPARVPQRVVNEDRAGACSEACRAPPHDRITLGAAVPDLPIFCTLTPDALRTRREGLLRDLLRQADAREDLPAGLRLRFAPSSETLSTIARAVDAERHCCRFLRFTITIEPDGGPIVLELTGPEGTREFVGALLES